MESGLRVHDEGLRAWGQAREDKRPLIARENQKEKPSCALEQSPKEEARARRGARSVKVFISAPESLQSAAHHTVPLTDFMRRH